MGRLRNLHGIFALIYETPSIVLEAELLYELDHQSQTNSLTNIFCHISFKTKVIEFSLCNTNISMLNMFKMDASSVSKSLTQSVIQSVPFLPYWFISQEYRLSKR